jgi:hypothetical protein
VVVEIQDWQRLAIYHDVAQTIDAVLLGMAIAPEIRFRDESGDVRVESAAATRETAEAIERRSTPRVPLGRGERTRIYPFGISWKRLEDAARALALPLVIVRAPEEADVVMTLRNYYRKKPQRLRDAEAAGTPVYVVKSNSTTQMEAALASIFELRRATPEDAAMEEARVAVAAIHEGQRDAVALSPQNAYIRRLQHEFAERSNLSSRSSGHEPDRRVEIYREDGRPAAWR